MEVSNEPEKQQLVRDGVELPSSSPASSQSFLSNLHCFSDEAPDGILHFQILGLDKQLYIWIGCNSAKLGQLYASVCTPFDRTPSLTALIGGAADSTGASIARRLSLRTGWSIILACNLPKNSPNLEAQAEKRLLQELKTLGYVQSPAVKKAAGKLAELSMASV